MFSRKTKKSKRNGVIAPLVVGLLGVSCFALWHALSIPSFAADPEETTEGIVVTGVSNVTEYLTSLVLYTDDPMSKTAVVLKYDADLNALIIEGAVNADALAIGSGNQIHGSGNVTLGGEKNIISNSNSNYSAIVGGKGNTINGSKSGTRSLTGSVIVGGEKNTLKNVNPNSLIIGGYLNTGDAGEYQVFLGGTGSKGTNNAKYFLVLGEGGNTVSSNSILMGGKIQGDKDKIFVWSDSGTFIPNYSNAFYVNTTDGFGLNTSSPKLKLDLRESGVLYIKKETQINTNNQVLGLECSKNKPEVKGTIAYINNGISAGLCGCNGNAWVPLSIDPFTQYVCASGSLSTTNCEGNPTGVIKNTSKKGTLRWHSDGNNGSGGWKYPDWTYGGVESPIGGGRECSYTCLTGYAPRTGDSSTNWDPTGRFTGNCVPCTDIENKHQWKTPGTKVDDCGFSCKAGYKYDQQARTCTLCSIGEWTAADNQTGTCSRCEMPKGTANVSSNNGTLGILKDGTPYFGNFVSVGTGGNKNSCKFTCGSGFVVSYKNNANNACVQCEVGKYSAGGSLTTCSSCTNGPDPIHYWVKQSKETRQGYTVSTGFFSYTSSSDQNNCDWECNSGYHFKNYGGVCRCSDIYTMHVEGGRCIHNSRYSSCLGIKPGENTILGSNVVFQTGGGIWNDFSWNDLPEWSYVSPEDYESQGQSLKNCQWTCPDEDYTVVNTTSERRCIAPPVGKCGSYGGRVDIGKNENLASVSPNLLCDMSVSTAATTPLYLEKDTNNYDYDEEGNVLRSGLSVERKGTRSRTCKGYEGKAKYSTLCTATVKGDKKPGVCDYNPSKSYFDSSSSYQGMCVSTGFVATGHAVIGGTNGINSFLYKGVTWECPGEYGGDWIRCGTCNTDYVFHTGSQLCYSKTRVVNCETGEKPSSWGVGYIYGTGKYTQTLNTEETTFKYEPIKKWEYASGSVTQNGGGNHACKFTCDKGYHKYGTTTKTCVQCLKSTSTVQGTYAANIGSDSCTAAEDGYYTDTYAATSQKVCPAGSYCPGGKIIDCPAGSYCPQGSAEPIKCGDGKYSSKNSKAPSDCKSISCGYYGSSESSSQPSGKKCSAGTYSAQGSKECSNCSAGTYSSAGACSCTSCVASSSTVAGTYSSSAGSSSCTRASDGYYTKETGATQQTICPAGYYCKDGKINDCPCGSYCTQGSSEPTECGAGKYSSANSTSSSACKNISAGYYGTSACSSTENKCAAGKYSKAGYSSCYNCLPGTYSSAGASSCTKCSAGTYSSSYGSTSCTNCGGGKWSAEGSSSCSNISCGYYGSSESSSQPSGKKCSAGTYSSAGSASCTDCSPNYYSANAGSCSCTKCPNGQTSAAGSSSCTEEKCPTGYQYEYTLQSADDCGNGTAKSDGWKLEQNGTANGHACVKCVAKSCPDGMSTTCDGNRHDSDYSGDEECHKCGGGGGGGSNESCDGYEVSYAATQWYQDNGYSCGSMGNGSYCCTNN